ncbi:MAG: hypothetical protein JNK82_10565 [Myxococcaceae bacterium]|nr:hypothetical protein [Myxococcaceae bacterium]
MLALISPPAFAAPPVRQEVALRFAVDEAFQHQSGVQYFYQLVPPEPCALTASPAFAQLRVLDLGRRWERLAKPPHVVVSRLSYLVEKDISFFSRARAEDVGYMNAVAKDYGISKTADGRYRVSKTPANSFTLTYFDDAAVRAAPADGAIARVSSIASTELPSSVLMQENTDFAPVLGVRTGELSVTWTAQYALHPGLTRLEVFTVSYLHNLPPFFLGGQQRVFAEAQRASLELIENLRAYAP